MVHPATMPVRVSLSLLRIRSFQPFSTAILSVANKNSCTGTMSQAAASGGEMILHEITRSCSGVPVHFDVVIMPGMLWLYIGDSDVRFDALSFSAGTQGQKIPTSSCLMKGTQEDIGALPRTFSFRFELLRTFRFQNG